MPAAPDDEGVVESINAAWGTALTVQGRAEKGTLGGAILVTLPGDRPGVVTRFLGPISAAQRTAQILSEARRRGLPLAEQHLVAPVGEDVLMVQERLPGRPPGSVTPAVITAIILLNEQFAHALRFWPEVPGVVLCLSASGDPYPRHEVLADHSDRSRAILRRIRSIGHGVPEVVAGDDLVHVDLTPDNVLFDDDGGVTGVVDWNLGVYRGDRHLALVKTRFDLEWCLQETAHNAESVAAARQLDTYLETTVPEPTLLRYWAHRVLNQLHWTLQSAPPDVVDWHLHLAETKLQ